MTAELLRPGQLFAGRYKIERPLAEGGFGAVYVAEQMSTELRVALKVLWPHVLASRDAVEKFHLEARVASRIQSQHVVQVLDAGFDDATKMPFLAMELLSGETLEQLVERSGPLPAGQLVTLMGQLASGLDKAHAHVGKDGAPAPIVHRDLKPENLFLTQREDGAPCLKILDYGIAKVLSADTQLSQEIRGTPLYMAPEQASGAAVTVRTDVWALGLIVFYALTGRSYWRVAAGEGNTLAQLFGEVLVQPLERPSERLRSLGGAPGSLPAEFDDWFFGCVQREPERRFASAGAAVRALTQVLQATGGPERLASPRGEGAGATWAAGTPELVAAQGHQLPGAITAPLAAGAKPAQRWAVTIAEPAAAVEAGGQATASAPLARRASPWRWLVAVGVGGVGLALAALPLLRRAPDGEASASASGAATAGPGSAAAPASAAPSAPAVSAPSAAMSQAASTAPSPQPQPPGGRPTTRPAPPAPPAPPLPPPRPAPPSIYDDR